MRFLISILLFSTLAQAGDDLSTRLSKVIEPQIEKRIKSTIVGVYVKGNVQFLTYGNVRPDPDTIFEIGSLTKTFTSLIFAIAIEKGLVTPDTTLAELRPEWLGQATGNIRLIELATHRSGLSRLPCDLKITNPANPYADYTEAQLIASITDRVGCKFAAHPTQNVVYSNWGAALLGNAISAASKLSYGEMLKLWITEPLGMKDTVIKLSPEQRLKLAQGYNEQLKPAGLWDRQGLLGNGAIMSSARDIMLYVEAMLHPEKTSFPEAIKRVETLQYVFIAYNWFVTSAGSIWHDGMTGGYSSLTKVYLKKDFAIFHLTNTEAEVKCFIEAVEEIPCQP